MPRVCIELTCDARLVEKYAAQIGLITAASLLGRLFCEVQAMAPEVPLHPSIRHTERTLAAALNREIARARPAELRGPSPGSGPSRTLRVHFGRDHEADVKYFGSGWTGIVGAEIETIDLREDENPFGPAMSAILAGAEVFLLALDVTHAVRAASLNTWDWNLQPSVGPSWREGLELGEVWTVGVGSVGSAALYFLTLSKLRCAVSLFDGDELKLENISRSPIFSAEDREGEAKVDVAARYLRANGTEVRAVEPKWIHESSLWASRMPGHPDLLISTANEHHVRWHIESAYPPVQLHASTGRNWQATLFRHIPIVDPCSLCIFPDEGVSAPLTCATGEVVDHNIKKLVDASLPFLSYAAGLMIAIEAFKLASGKHQASRRIYLQTRGDPLVLCLPMSSLATCSCHIRQARIHLSAIEGSRFESLSRS
jgi:molybdopterin/thiamine biosynthesis adenylyltransferase